MRFEKKGKLSPQFVRPSDILQRVGKLAYQLALPPAMIGIHEAFRVSMPRKYVSDPTHILKHQEVEITQNLRHVVHPTMILDRKKKVLRNKSIPLVKVMCKGHTTEKATWELESDMRKN